MAGSSGVRQGRGGHVAGSRNREARQGRAVGVRHRVRWRDVRQGRNAGRMAEEAVGHAAQAKCKACAGGRSERE